jgi:ribonuclease HII
VSPTAPRPRRPSPSVPPSLRLERQFLREGRTLVAGMDEVGRGSLAGPVSVGVLVVDAQTRTAPTGLRDSKLLSPAVREVLAPKVARWAVASAVGHAEPDEIDAIGIIAALRLAGRRALAQLPVLPDLVILDGNHDWLSSKAPPRCCPARRHP